MMTNKTISCRVTGYRKLIDGRPCEDATRVVHLKTATIVAVADGHGDHRCVFAHIGSELAVRAACEALKSYNGKIKNENPSVYWNSRRIEIAQCVVQIFSRFAFSDYITRCPEVANLEEQKEIFDHIDGMYTINKEACTPDEIRKRYAQKKRVGDKLRQILYLYGTTIRASLVSDKYMFHMALGDGDTTILVQDSVEWVLPKSEAYECETASLCEDPEEVLNDFVFSYTELRRNDHASEKLDDVGICPQMLILSTDGLRNSFYSERAFVDKLYAIYKYATEGKFDRSKRNLKNLLTSLSRNSVYQDDISITLTM